MAGKRSAGFNFTGPLAGVGNSMLSRFGIKAAVQEREVAKKQTEVLKPGVARKVPLPMLLWLGARLPFGAFVLILAMFTFAYHLLPLVPWMLCFLFSVFATVVCYPAKEIHNRRRNFWDWGPMYSWILAVGLGMTFGLINYSILESWINTTFLVEVTGVKANANPVALMDAGILTFAEDAMLNTSAGAGYKFWLSNYCAAPIVNTDDAFGAPITFWAVGLDCCGGRGAFTCDSAQDKSTHKAVPLRPYTIGPEITAHYNAAIKMAAAANNFEIAKETVFVNWHKDPKAVGKWCWWFCTMNFIALTLVALCACCACQSGLTHISVMQQQ